MSTRPQDEPLTAEELRHVRRYQRFGLPLRASLDGPQITLARLLATLDVATTANAGAAVGDEPCGRCGTWRRFHGNPNAQGYPGPEYSRDHEWATALGADR